MTTRTRTLLAAAALIVSGCRGVVASDDYPPTESVDANAMANRMDAASSSAPGEADASREDATSAINRGVTPIVDASAEKIDMDAGILEEKSGEEAAADVGASEAMATGAVVDAGFDVEHGARSIDGGCAWTLIHDTDLSTGPMGLLTSMSLFTTVIEDLNGDGKQDVAFADTLGNSVDVFLGMGDGGFRPGVSYDAGASPASVAIGDLNGDKHPDLVVASPTDDQEPASISVMLGRGDGTFGTPTSYDVGATPLSVAIGDLNGDSHPDLIVSNWSDDTLSVLLGRGDGTFGPEGTYPVYQTPGVVALGDLNGDGKLDVVVPNTGDTTSGPLLSLSVLLGNGDGTFQPYVWLQAAGDPRSVAIGDLNGDGKLDLAVADEETADVSLGNGDGTFQPETAWLVGREASGIAITDLNADGVPDLVLTNTDEGTLSVLLGYGDGTFASQVTFSTDASPYGLSAGDLNGDGHPDLVMALYDYDSGAHTVGVFLDECQR